MTTTTGEAPPDPGELEPLVGDETADTATPTVPRRADDGLFDDERVDRRPWITLAIVGAVTLFVVWNLRPWVWFIDTTPTGGDLGAHVWSPAYLRDVLLPDWRLTGWSPDWYAGFPAFTFYMVVPSLLIVIVNVGLDVSIGAVAMMSAGLAGYVVAHRLDLSTRWRLGSAAGTLVFAGGLHLLDGENVSLPIPRIDSFTYSHTPLEVVLAVVVLPALAGVVAWRVLPRTPWRGPLTAVASVLVVLAVPVPYGIAMKLVVVSGLVTLPVAAWAAGRLGGLAYPGPALMAVMTLPFIFDRSYNIYGGNLMSTMAGEFAYSIGLTLAVLYIGVAARGLETGRHRGLAAGLLALTGLTHLFPVFFALLATAAMLVVRSGRRSLSWLAVTGPLAGLLAAFWVVPFVWNRQYLNDMGWGKERRYVAALWSRGGNFGDQTFLDNDPILQVFVVLAIVGAVVCGFRRVRFGMVLSITAMALAAAFVLLPETRLWNVRILPFYYLTIYLMAGIAVAEISRLLFEWRPAGIAGVVLGWRTGAVAIATGLIVMISLAIPLHALPFGNSESGEYGYSWSGGLLSTTELNLGPYWLSYNFLGYEENRAPTEAGGGTSEYTDMVATMAKVGTSDHGCGRALWEFESSRLGSYGTTMAPMLLPHWTDRCIDSMEGLYFEASATTPYHFLLQSELSSAPSRAQRDLPYSELDVAAGVPHLQALGVRYYMAFSEAAIAQASAQPELTEIATSGPWVVFLVADTDLVVGLDHLPVVMEGTDEGGEEWLVPSVASWEAGDLAPLIAADGPADWPHVESLTSFLEDEADFETLEIADDRVAAMALAAEQLPDWLGRTSIEPVEVFDIASDESSISFSVAQPGLPVLVRTSYFPNWSVSGADGPYRVAPNLMVVVPTDTDVELNYGRSGIEGLSILLTLAGFAGLVALGRMRPAGAGPDGWDLAAEPPGRLGREEVIAGVRRGSIDSIDVAAMRRSTLADQRSALVLLACGLVLIGGSLVASAFVWDLTLLDVLPSLMEDGSVNLNAFLDERANRPLTALAIYTPAAVGLLLIVLRAVPRALAATAHLNWTIASASLIAELVDDRADPAIDTATGDRMEPPP